MAAKEITFSVENRDRILRGISKLNRAVAVTLGPKGRNVVIEKSFGAPVITKDGVTVAKEIELEDKIENMGAQMVRQRPGSVSIRPSASGIVIRVPTPRISRPPSMRPSARRSPSANMNRFKKPSLTGTCW